MGIGLEVIFFIALLLGAGLLLYIAFKRFRSLPKDQRSAGMVRFLSLLIGGFLLIALAVNIQFCSQQKNRMDKNTHEDNSVDNVGKGENEQGNERQNNE